MRQGTVGWIEVICGSMFSGKTEELIRRLRRAQIARQRVQIFKPKIDERYSQDHLVSHSEMRLKSEAVSSADEILQKIDWRAEVIGVDERGSHRHLEAVAPRGGRLDPRHPLLESRATIAGDPPQVVFRRTAEALQGPGGRGEGDLGSQVCNQPLDLPATLGCCLPPHRVDVEPPGVEAASSGGIARSASKVRT